MPDLGERSGERDGAADTVPERAAAVVAAADVCLGRPVVGGALERVHVDDLERGGSALIPRPRRRRR